MGFMSHRQKNVEIRPEQKWDYISLNDFKSSSCFAPLAYAYLYFSLVLSIAVYAVDTFTAVNLLVFNKWSSEIAPTQLISFTASKWIFSVCIILSFVNLAYEHIRAQRIMHRGSVAECYLDNLAVRLESIRWGKGQGWKRFLVFAELTKSKKGAEYIALFTYFSFQSWIRVLLCSGPRQAVNALTLLSVYNAQLSVTGDNVGNTLLNFFDKIRTLAEENAQEALILSGMIFTLVIWVFSFLSLLLAFAFFLFFLWSYIPRSDGGLSGYCSRKINKRLMKIVATKVNTAIEEEERRRKKAELKAAMKAGELPPTELTATIPNVGDDKLPQRPMINRNDTMASRNDTLMNRSDTMTPLPPYTSRPGTAGSFELNALDQKPRPMPSRSGTMATMSSMATTPSGTNFSARAPLLGYAAEPGMSGRSTSPTPSIPTLPELGGNSSNGYSSNNYGPSLTRTGTADSNHSFGGPAPGNNGGAGVPPFPQLSRTNTGGSMPFDNNTRNGSFSSNGYTANPAVYPNDTMPAMPAMPQPARSPAAYGSGSRNGSQSGPQDFGHNASNSTSSGRYVAYRPDDNGRESPAPSARSYGPGGGMNNNNNSFPAPSPRGMMPPMRSATNPNPISPRTMTNGSGPGNSGSRGYGNGNGAPYGPPYGPPQRNMTAPMPQMGGGGGAGVNGHERQFSGESSYSSYFERPSTASSQRGPSGPPRRPSYGNNGGGAWNNDVESQRGRY